MPNTNCLKGVRCPSCGQEDAFQITARVSVLVTDDGTEDSGGDYERDHDAPTRCIDCGKCGPLSDFTTGEDAP